MRGFRSLSVAVALTSLLGVTACSSGANPADVHATASTFTAEDSTASASSANPSAVTSPNPGAVSSRDHSFNFVVPAGWNLTDQPKALAYLSSTTVAHDVAPTMVVTKSDVSPAPALEETVQMAMMQARQDGSSTNKAAGRTIGGEKAEGFTADSQEKGVSVRRMYYVVNHEGTAYTIAVTTAKADERNASSTLNSWLSSWSWSKPGDKNSTASGTTPPLAPTTTSSPASSVAGSASAASTQPGNAASTSAPPASKKK